MMEFFTVRGVVVSRLSGFETNSTDSDLNTLGNLIDDCPPATTPLIALTWTD